MRKTPNSWSKSKSAKNLLFFVQVIEELLNDHSWDNYRVYTLDTIGRLRDLRYVANGMTQPPKVGPCYELGIGL